MKSQLAKDEKCVAIGEIGLDYHYEKDSREQQLILLEKQIQLANELGLPIIFHDRESHEDTLNILKKYKPKASSHSSRSSRSSRSRWDSSLRGGRRSSSVLPEQDTRHGLQTCSLLSVTCSLSRRSQLSQASVAWQEVSAHSFSELEIHLNHIEQFLIKEDLHFLVLL